MLKSKPEGKPIQIILVQRLKSYISNKSFFESYNSAQIMINNKHRCFQFSNITYSIKTQQKPFLYKKEDFWVPLVLANIIFMKYIIIAYTSLVSHT